MGKLGDGRSLGEHTLGHALDLIDGEHFELVDTLLEELLFFGDGGSASQFVDGCEILLFGPDLQGDDLTVRAGGLNGLSAAITDELTRSAGTFKAINGVEGEDEGIHSVRGTLATGEDVVEVDGFAADIAGIEGFAGVGAGVAQVGGDAHFAGEAGGDGGGVAIKGFRGLLRGLKGRAAEGGNLGVDFLFFLAGEVFNVAGDFDEEVTDSGGIVLGVVVDDVTKEAEEDFDTVANEVVVGGAVDLLLGERVFPGGIAIEDVSFLARVFTGEDFGDGLAHDTLGIRGATRGEIHGEFLRRGISASCWFNLHKERKNICTEDRFAFGEAVAETAEGLLGLFVLTEVFDTEGRIELGKAGIADKHVFVGVRAREKGVEVVMVAGNEISNGFLEVTRSVTTGLADALIERLQFCGDKGAERLAHEADADVAEEFGPAEGKEGIAGFERSLDAIDGTTRRKAVVEAGFDLSGEKAAKVGLGNLGPGAEGIGLALRVGHEGVNDLLGEAGEFADMGTEDGLSLLHGVQAVEGKVEGLVVL